MAINVDIAANTRDFQAGVKDVDKALSDVADTLDDLTRDTARNADKAGDALEDGIKDGAKDAERAVERLEDSFKDLSDKARRESDDAGKSLKGVGSKSAEVGGELRQNIGETFSSFRGDVEDFGQIAQDTLGGLAGAGALGGIAGAAVTAAGAAGVGALIGAFEQAEEKRKELEERADDLASAYIDAGSTVLDAMSVASRTASALADPDEKKKIEEYADALGTDLATAARAYVGDANAMAFVNRVVSDSQEELNGLHEKSNAQQTNLTQTERNRIAELNKLITAGSELNGVTDAANATFQTQQQVLFDLINSADGATKQVDAVGNALYSLPDGTQIMVDAETGQATTDVANFKGDVDGIPESVTTTVRARTSGVSAAERELAQLARNRNVVVNVKQQITRIGNQVW